MADESNARAPSSSTMRLPVEVLVIVAEFLLGDACYGSVASLNATCKLVNEETQSALCTMMVLDHNFFRRMTQDFQHRDDGENKHDPGWRHVRYLVIESGEFYGSEAAFIERFDYEKLFPAVVFALYAMPHFPPMLLTDKSVKKSDLPKSYVPIVAKSVQTRSLGLIFKKVLRREVITKDGRTGTQGGLLLLKVVPDRVRSDVMFWPTS